MWYHDEGKRFAPPIATVKQPCGCRVQMSYSNSDRTKVRNGDYRDSSKNIDNHIRTM